MNKEDQPTYAAEPGREDPQGEMTGAISVNMILSMLPVTVWCFFIGPALMGFWWVMATGVGMAIVLPIACLPVSRRIWAWLSHVAEGL